MYLNQTKTKKCVIPFIEKVVPNIQKQVNESCVNVNKNKHLNENPLNNFAVADSQKQQVNDNQRNTGENNDFNEQCSSNLPVVDPPQPE